MIVLSALLEITAFIFAFYYLLGCNFNKKKPHIIFSSLISILWIFFLACIKLPFPNTITIMIIILLLFDCKISFKLTWVIICTTLELICSFFCFNCSYIIVYYLLKQNYNPHGHLSSFDFVIFLLVIVISPFLQKSRQKRAFVLQKMNAKVNIFIALVCICIIFLANALELIFTGSQTQNIFYLLTFLSLIMIALTIITVSLIFKIQYNKILLNQLFRENQEMLALEKAQYQLLHDKNNELRAFRHDFNDHMLSLQTYVNKNETDKLYEYINKLSSIHSDLKIYSTKNIIVDAILNQIGETLPSDVFYKVSGHFNESCFINDFELCTLFTNLLKNAVDAINKLDPGSSREIYVEIESVSNEIQIRVMNTSKPYTDEELNNLTTTKKDRTNHGFGLANIRQIVDKHNGDLFITYENGFFSIYISCKQIDEPFNI